MTQEDTAERNKLEQILEELQPDPEHYSAFFAAFATEPLTVAVAPPWEDLSQPPPVGSRMLFVSDGDNHEQGMLAVFTRPGRAEAFCREYPTDEEFRPYETGSAWIFLQVPDNCGIMLNPNEPHNFRISPELTADLKQDVIEALQRARGAQGAS